MAEISEAQDSAEEYRATGDALRDAARWAEAATSYEAFLAIRPDDTAIRVQFGHCLKEKGAVAAALGQYQHALTEAPDDSDIHLQIGHALKLLGRQHEARQAYEKALFLAPESVVAMVEINALAQQLPSSDQKTIIFDISDLIQYIRERHLPTGIQRVQLNIIQRALTECAGQANLGMVYLNPKIGEWVFIERDFFLTLYDCYRKTRMMTADDFDRIIALLDANTAHAARLEDRISDTGFTLFSLGTSWWIENYFLHIRALREKYPLRFVSIIYDCIPIIAPEHCDARLVSEFAQWFSTLGLESDAVLTISEWSALDSKHHFSSFLPMADVPITPIALNGDMRRDLAALPLQDTEAEAPETITESPFVLCVGTLESRKNHLMLFQAWQNLIDRHGFDAIPALICVGKPGWLFDPAAAYLRERPQLGQKIRLISGLADAGLAELYAQCLFTVFNSDYEGWGLPVTESLSYGRLALVACNSALTEAGGRAAIYFRTGDMEDLLDKLETLIFDDEKRRHLQAEAQAHTAIRDWGAIAADFLAALLKVEPSAIARQQRLLRLELGRILHLGKGSAPKPSLDLALADMLRLGLQWHRLEDWGCWTAPGIATLRLPLPDQARGQDLRLYLRLRGCAFDTPIRVTLRHQQEILIASAPILIGEGTRHTVLLKFRPDVPEVEIDIDGGPGTSLGPGDRDVGIGVTDIMICAADDEMARQGFSTSFPELQARLHAMRDDAFDQIEMPVS